MTSHEIHRRQFLKTSGGLAAAAAASGTVSLTFSVSAWAKELTTLSEHEGKMLLRMARQIYPHPSLADMYYAGVVNDLDREARENPQTAALIKEGVAKLDLATDIQWLELSDGNQLEVLRGIETSPFFQKVKGTALISLYNNPLVWRELGYEGPSAHLGGYIDRGFNDLRWLEEPPESASPKAG
ncbi:MAG: twin-arginine translocation signal domain-containing protein [Gammaproteobacteria bacterium]|nr:twin-arginine translocation signal domain-containing protein [Gammaproteobacteria bacterium]NIR83458.1 twin-arginine translocation signal domain-containing protein [Gammaproteobacteria bacterium]NIR91380.1 twin-arginine translocation signal domain-containing protein [Gammaproteobacteria bacterium]NIU04620.1 twin-arginine translocation signal domain-containing protein [Gammaproteobacteria bacterium]NIV51662.1 twin-arginine translocation signal domain-containing protein [Gammaproteobacteria ba